MTCGSGLRSGTLRKRVFPVIFPLTREYGPKSPQIDDLDPVRLLAHRVLLEAGQGTRLRVDPVERHRVRIEPDRQQEAAARVDIEAARRRLGREMADRRQSSFFGVDAVTGQRAGLTLAAVEKPAVGGHVQVGGSGLLLEVGGRASTNCCSVNVPVAGSMP